MNRLTIDLDKAKEHIEHSLVFTTFGKDGDVWNYTLACEDCGEVIADIDVPLDDRHTEKYYTLAEAIGAGVDYYEDEDGILQRVDERIDENGKDIS